MKVSYVALLRAINVGGHTVKMEALRQIFADVGCDNVCSYIQSGNVFFESSEKDQSKLVRKIEAALLKKLGYEVPTMLRTLDEFKAMMATDPFRGISVDANTRLSILFFAQPIKNIPPLPYVSPKGDIEIVHVDIREAYVVMRYQPGKVPDVARFMKQVFDQPATARFWHTAQKILTAAQAA